MKRKFAIISMLLAAFFFTQTKGMTHDPEQSKSPFHLTENLNFNHQQPVDGVLVEMVNHDFIHNHIN